MGLPAFVQDFTRDFSQFLRQDLEPFAFVRFHDGEYHAIEGLDHIARSGWRLDGGPTWIQFPLIESLEYVDERYFIGITPPCDHPESTHAYRERLRGKTPIGRLTFASIFAQSNYGRISQIRERYHNAILVGPTNKCDVQVPINGVGQTWDVDALVARLMEVEGRPILVAAGPCANIIIHRYWTRQDPTKRVIILDIGAAYDETIHGKPTRDYQGRRTGPPHKCSWTNWKPFQPLTEARRQAAHRRYLQSQRFKQLSSEGFHQSINPSAVRPKERSPNWHERRPPGPNNNRNVKVRKDRRERR